jgi:hypothetical protein
MSTTSEEVARLKSEIEFLHLRRGQLCIERDRAREALEAVRGCGILPISVARIVDAALEGQSQLRVTQLQTQAKVYKGDVDPEDWVVWAIGDDGDIIVSVFAGDDAEGRALEYAGAKYAGFMVLPKDTPRPNLRLVKREDAP